MGLSLKITVLPAVRLKNWQYWRHIAREIEFFATTRQEASLASRQL